MNKKLIIDCRLIDKSKNTGISRYIEFLITYYLHHYKNSEILLISNSYININNIECAVTKLRPYNFFHFFLFPFFVAKFNVNLLHSPFYSSLCFKFHGIKNIVTVHDLMYTMLPNFFSNNLFLNLLGKLYYSVIVKISLNNADIIISDSISTQSDLLLKFNLSSFVIPLNSDISSQMDPSFLKKSGLDNKGYFFYCGSDRLHKNIKFIRSVFEENPNLPILVLAGPNHLASTNRVKILGLVKDSELSSLYQGCIALIFPSLYEGFGLPILEAYRSGCHVVASKIPAFLEFSDAPIFYFNLNDKLDLLNAIRGAMNASNPRVDSFLEEYSNSRIYSLLDRVTNSFQHN
jgi:glycosyltransferase involved in cell wall biosynthesis